MSAAEDLTSKLAIVGTTIYVAHRGTGHDRTGCKGGTAKVVKANDTTFIAECSCGWLFGGMQTDRYPRL